MLSLLGICLLAFLSYSSSISAQSDYLVFERAYEHYAYQRHTQSISLLESHLQTVENPNKPLLLLNPKAYNRGLLILLQLNQEHNFFIHPDFLSLYPSEFAHYISRNEKSLLWQKIHQNFHNQKRNTFLQNNISEGLMLAGMSALQLQQMTRAQQYFKAVLQWNPNQKEAELGNAMAVFQIGDPTTALEMLNDFSVENPHDYFADLCRAEIYLHQKYYDRAAKALDIFFGHLPSNQELLSFNHHDLLMLNGHNKMFLRNYDVAETYFSKAIELKEENEDAFVARAEARAYLLKLKEAEEDLFIARSLNRENPHVFHMLGYVKMLQWQNEEALAYFTKAIDLQSNVKEAYIHRSSVKSILGDIEGAIEDLNQVIQMDDKADKSYAVRAYLKTRKGDLKGALTDYNQAVALAPNNAGHFIGRAAIKEQLEMEESYLDDLDKAISLNPNNYYPYHAKGAWYQRQKENDKALKAYTQAIEIAPDIVDIYLDRGSIHLAEGNPKGALEDLGTVISLEPKNGQAYFLQGILYFLLEKNLKACASMSKAKSLGFEDAEESLTTMCGE